MNYFFKTIEYLIKSCFIIVHILVFLVIFSIIGNKYCYDSNCEYKSTIGIINNTQIITNSDFQYELMKTIKYNENNFCNITSDIDLNKNTNTNAYLKYLIGKDEKIYTSKENT